MDVQLHFFKLFTNQANAGNPAAAMLLSHWPEDAVLAGIARSANQVVTAFAVQASEPGHYHIRWFSTQQEINLCGHGTLALAALIRQLKGEGTYQFVSPYGQLTVAAQADLLQMALPVFPNAAVSCLPDAFAELQVEACFQTRDLILVLPNEHAVQQFQPDFSQLLQLEQHALIVTALTEPNGYVLRYFAPKVGIDEDIATGSAQCSLAPYWAARTGLTHFKVRQLSGVEANFTVRIAENRVVLVTDAIYLAELTQRLSISV